MIARPGSPRFFENRIHFRSLDSTNDFARRLVAFLEEDEKRLPPSVIVADEQTAGRGRGGRACESPRGSLYLTATWPAPPAEERMHLPLAVGVVVTEALRAAFAVDVRLAWPGDLVVEGRKLAGILAEIAVGRVSRAETLIVGIGVNVLVGAVSSAGRGSAVTLAEVAGRAVERDEVLHALVGALERETTNPRSRTAFLAAWVDLSVHDFGAPIRVQQGSAEWIEGAFGGLDEAGRLEIETATGIRSLPAWEFGA